MSGRGVFHVHRAERADRLATELAGLLADPLTDPFATEVVAVAGRGLERWLVQRLSHHLGAGPAGDGVCAGVAFPSADELVARALGVDDADPWTPQRMAWPLLDVVDACVGESWCAALTAYVTRRAGRRVAAARHVADLFAAYADHRPEMLCAWAAKEDTGDGAVPDDLAWQPELWRRLRDRIGVPSPAEELAERCERLRAEPGGADLPERLSLFGPVRLPARHLRVVAALAAHRDVHLWLPHPSPARWERSAAGPRPARARRAGVDDTEVDAADPAGLADGHPLLASLGRDVRELQQRLRTLDVPITDTHHPGDPAPPTVLGGLQDDLRHDRAPVRRGADASLTVHACHGPDRQVEVLREAVLGLLARDPTLEPRDVVVLCPDLDTYAPLVTATFGLGAESGHPGHLLPVRLADRSLRQVNPLLAMLARLLELADARVTAAELLDLAESEPVRRRFGFDDDALDELRELVARSGVRWGLDAEHRRPFGLAAYPQNSWSAGLDRLLLGVAMSEDDHRWLGTALPLDDVDSGLVDLVGRLAELVDRVTTVLDGLTGSRPLRAWTETLAAALDALTTVPPSESWQATQARAELAGVGGAGGASTEAPLTLADVRAVLADRLAGRPARVTFASGALTVATPAPLRAVPHRVVCLLGLDDGVFPREGAPDGDDVLAHEPRIGEPDPRAEDRATFLDAISAATEHLVVVHSGADERTGAARPPAVPLDELLDVVGRDVVRTHPLQPFDPRNFTGGDPRDGGAPFSFDAVALAGAQRASHAATREVRAFLDGPLAPWPEGETALDDLVRFVEHPVRAFLAQRLGLYAGGEDSEPADDAALPVEPDGLTQWSVGERLLTDRLAGAPAEQCRQAEWRRGELPPGTLGHRLLERIQASVEPLVELAAPLRTDAVRAVDVDLRLELPGTDEPRRLVGTVSGLRGATLLTVTYSRLAAKHRLRAWVNLLALTAQTGHELRAVTLGRGSRGAARSVLGPVPPERARTTLADLVALRAEGLCLPLPLAAQTSCAYAEHLARGADPADARETARERWSGRFGDGVDVSHRRVWGEMTFDGLPRERFAELAERVWRPLLAAERKDAP